MNGQQCIDKFHNYVSDELDSDFELQLVNDAKNSVEAELMLEITKKLDSTGTVSAGQTYTTARSLPSDFYLPLPIFVGNTIHYPVPFERQQEFQGVAGYYWVDMANSTYYLSGTQGQSATIYFYYQYQTPDIALNTSPVWPDRFHSIIPLEMARIYWQIDQGEKNRAWTLEYQADWLRWKHLMQDWDSRLKLNAISSYQPTESENRINL